ncbi:hypothetical protein [Mesorhizobium australicum]|uniref:Twin-arginine translocation signal domain-containing protein n=1 Tax=Mesorhizobium australicum TaxID=536018 RepID=A0A1X7NFC7_9HYPH|nr:hypothetical protein [Mesorhizobium australicum]SMH36037.1 hypothetical protein SAMN02982922_1678 [Mesorhizobium australicum]
MADSRLITRRLFMRHGAAAGAALSTVPLAASSAQAAEEPVQRVNRLAKELSHAMDDWMADLGRDGVPDLWQAHIWPASVHEHAIWFEHVTQRFQPTPQERVDLARRELIDATKAAYPDVSDWRVLTPTAHCADNERSVGIFMLIGHK